MISSFVSPSRSPLSGLDSYFRDIKATPILSELEEKAICQRIGEGDAEARDHLVRANLRLVVSIARSYCRDGVDLQDLIAEGNLGLIRAAEAFDPEVGTRFTTYAKFWIKQSIKRLVINNAKPIRLPAYMNELMVKWHRAKKQLHDELQRPATSSEIAARLELNPAKLKMIQQAIQIYNAGSSPGKSDETNGIELLLVDDERPAEETLVEKEDIQKILHLLDSLDEREATVLRMRFGLGNEEPCTLVTIGERLGLTRERVRQIEKLALANLAKQLADGSSARGSAQREPRFRKLCA
jgi:RNA polymerase primary sigma factor